MKKLLNILPWLFLALFALLVIAIAIRTTRKHLA